VIFDGHALVHRAFHALPPLSVSKTGEPTGAVYGFVMMLLKVLQDLEPTHWAISFDRPTPTFRHLEYEAYKAQRPRAPDELVRQFKRVREVVDAFRMPVFEVDGYEADDVLGTIARAASSQGIATIIVTGDNDELQLVSDKVSVLLPQRTFGETTLHDVEAVRKKFGISPEQIPDLKALKGDTSDNIPGVPGVGDKTAVRLLGQFGSIENIYRHIDEVTPPKLRELLASQETTARSGKRLATIITNVPIDFDLQSCEVGHQDRNRLVELFRELEFYRVLDRLPGNNPETQTTESAAPAAIRWELVTAEANLDSMVDALSSASSINVQPVCERRGRSEVRLLGIALCASPVKAYYVPLNEGLGSDMFAPGFDLNGSGLSRLLSDSRIAKVAHDSKSLLSRLSQCGVVVNNLDFDTMIAAYLLGDKSLSLAALSLNRLGTELSTANGRSGKPSLISYGDVESLARKACTEVVMIGRLHESLRQDLERGVKLEVGLLQSMSRGLGVKLAELERLIYGLAGRRFNINSPQQLGTVLFDQLKLPKARKTKSGYSTEAAVLEELKGSFPIVGLILEYRQTAKLKSTYIDALPALVDVKTGRLHTSFNQTVAATGRLSSSEPNLQNIPIRGDLGRHVRRAFVAESDWHLVSGDYSQIDLRVLAHLSHDERLLRAFREDKDIHTETATELFGVTARDVIPEMRRVAKVVNFGIIYGMSDYGLEQATDLTREQAATYIGAYFERHPGVRKYIESTKQFAREKGWVKTMLGRKRYIGEINSSNRQVREAAERMAINMPVQGTAADIIKIAMVRLQRMVDERRLASRMILQIHDELLLEVPSEELEVMRGLVGESMSGAMQLSVPLKVDVKVGQNWGDMEVTA